MNKLEISKNTKFNICIINFGISVGVNIETAMLIYYALTDIGFKSKITKNVIETESINIILGIHFFDINEVKKLPKNTIIFNTEPMELVREEWRNRIITFAKAGFHFWDYNQRNIDYFEKNGLKNFKLFFFGFHPKIKTINKKKISERKYDILFYGSINRRREKILNELVKKNFKRI